MSSDPYGFPEEAPKQGSPQDAVISLWTGIGSLICGALGPCLCYLPWLLGLPLSVAALYYGARARSSPEVRGQPIESAANAGLVSGGVGLLMGVLFLMLVLFYLAYIFLFIGLAATGEL